MLIYEFLRQIFNGKTIARALLFARLKEFFGQEKKLRANLDILEIGYERASHHRILPAVWNIKRTNYKAAPEIDLIINAEEKFPVGDREFDGSICFNTLYVVKDYENCLSEMLRVSKGFILFNTFLILGIVSQPNDFTRTTEDRLCDVMEKFKDEAGVKRIKIMPVGGSFSAAASLVDPYLKFKIARALIGLPAIILDKLDRLIKRKCPIMYLVFASKND